MEDVRVDGIQTDMANLIYSRVHIEDDLTSAANERMLSKPAVSTGYLSSYDNRNPDSMKCRHICGRLWLSATVFQ